MTLRGLAVRVTANRRATYWLARSMTARTLNILILLVKGQVSVCWIGAVDSLTSKLRYLSSPKMKSDIQPLCCTLHAPCSKSFSIFFNLCGYGTYRLLRYENFWGKNLSRKPQRENLKMWIMDREPGGYVTRGSTTVRRI